MAYSVHSDPYQSVSHTPEQLPNFGVNESASTKYGVAHWIRFVEKILIIKLRYGWNTSVTKIGIPRFTRHLRYSRSRFFWCVGIMGIIPIHETFPLMLISHGATHSPQAASCMVYPVWSSFIIFKENFFVFTTDNSPSTTQWELTVFSAGVRLCTTREMTSLRIHLHAG